MLAVLNAEAIAPPKVAVIRTFLRKPVIRLSNVAIAMEPVDFTTLVSEVSLLSAGGSLVATATGFAALAAIPKASNPGTSGGATFSLERSLAGRVRVLVFRCAGTGAGGAGVIIRRRSPESLTRTLLAN